MDENRSAGERRASSPIEAAWVLIANAYGGDWELASPEWREAAERWRDEVWHRSLPKERYPASGDNDDCDLAADLERSLRSHRARPSDSARNHSAVSRLSHKDRSP